MRISFEISKDHAVVALMYYLSLGTVIRSRKAFRQQLTTYFQQNGLQCIDDHESENERYRIKAAELVNKYFK